jgi:glycosyltransferase involved in cell wall biosynthesis
MLSVAMAPIARARRAKLVNWVQDLFPEVLEALDADRTPVRSAAYNILRRMRNRSLRHAQVNIAIGERMAERLAYCDVPPQRIRIIPNWANSDLVSPRPRGANPLRREWGLEEKFVVGYSGNLGRAHDVSTFIEAIARLEQDCNQMRGRGREEGLLSDVVWLFVGGGALYRQLQSEIAARRFTSVQFRPYQPRERLAESLSVPDVHLVSLRPELEGLIVPSKYYGIAAVGRPTIFIGDMDGELARTLKAERGGDSVELGDGAKLAALIRSFAANPKLVEEMGRSARSAFERSFDFPVAVSAWQNVLAGMRND